MNTNFVEKIWGVKYDKPKCSIIHPNDIIGKLYGRYIFDIELNKVLIEDGIPLKDLSPYKIIKHKFTANDFRIRFLNENIELDDEDVLLAKQFEKLNNR